MKDLGAPPATMVANTTAAMASMDFRSFMAGFPTGVGIVTTTDPAGGRPWGMTCSSLCSVSVDPPTLLVCLRRGSPTLDAVLRRLAFAVNLLHERGRRAAELFASGDPDRFGRVRWSTPSGCGGPHLVDDAHAVADCRVLRHDTIGDHTVVFGEVYQVQQQPVPHSLPLLYGRRQYASWPLR